MKIIIFLLFSILVCTSCKNTDKNSSQAFSEDNDSLYVNTSSTESYNDTGKTSESEGTTTLFTDNIQDPIQNIESSINDIHSPDQLVDYIDEYEKEFDRLESIITNSTIATENNELENKLNELSAQFEQQFNKYSLPANGILQKMQSLKERINACKSKQEFEGIMDVHYGYYEKLPKLYKIVQEPNRRQEVRSQAQELLDLFNSKAQEFGIVLH